MCDFKNYQDQQNSYNSFINSYFFFNPHNYYTFFNVDKQMKTIYTSHLKVMVIKKEEK